jgi:hypothetical protein
MSFSFDTFGACHEIILSTGGLQTATAIIDNLLEAESEEERRPQYESAKELFAKIGKGSATEGWAKLAPGTPVSNIRVVRPTLIQRLLERLIGRANRNKA